ncbi:MAG TPA: GIY-YIG nuclease family protein [Candidatus Paceibacterota bacterium]
MYFAYIIESEKMKRYYIGYTNNISYRLSHHNSGANRSTRPFRPWMIVYQEACLDKKSAWLRERQIKSYKGGEAFKKLIGCVA